MFKQINSLNRLLIVVLMAVFVSMSSGCALGKINNQVTQISKKIGLPVSTGADCSTRYPSNLNAQLKCINQASDQIKAQVAQFSAIFAALSGYDKGKVTKTRNTTIATGQPGTYRNPKTGVEVNTKVVNKQKQQKNVEIAVQNNRVKELPPIELVGKPFKTIKGASVRNGPGKNYKVVDSYAGGKKVHVVGKVKGKNWYLVSKDNVANGYIHSSLLQESTARVVVASKKPNKPKPSANTSIQTAQAETECQTVETEVTQNGKVGKESQIYCIGPNGAYVI